MAKSIEEIKALSSRGVGFGSSGKEATIELSPADVAAIENAAAKNSAVKDTEPTETKQSADTPEDEGGDPEAVTPPTLDINAVQDMIAKAIATSNQAHKDEVDELKAAHAQQLQEVQSAASEKEEAANNEAAALQNIISGLGLDKFKGNAQPVTNEAPAKAQPMTVVGTGSQESRNYLKMVNNLPGMVVESRRGGQVVQRDTRSADEYWRNNKTKIRDGLEAEMREAGLLQGTAVTNAITDVADIPSLSFEYLSASIRNSHFPDLIHSQFATYQLELGTRPGLVIAVPRFDDIARPATFSDRVLTPGTSLNTDAGPLLEKNVLITLQELGLGKDASNTVIGLSTFVSAYSLNNLESIIVNKLGRDFMVTKDMGLYEQWFGTNTVVYNDGGAVTTTATDVDTGDLGTMNQAFLINLRAYLKGQEIPTFDDGCYGLALNPTALAQYMIDKSSKERDDAMAGQDLVGNMLANSTGNNYGGELSGYRGKYDGFHIFEQNVYGIGVAGEAGAQSSTLGAGPGATLTYSSFAFGPRTIAWGEGLPVEIRMSTDDDFQRQKLMTWYAHATPGTLNVKNTTATGEQLRVVEIRTTLSAV